MPVLDATPAPPAPKEQPAAPEPLSPEVEAPAAGATAREAFLRDTAPEPSPGAPPPVAEVLPPEGDAPREAEYSARAVAELCTRLLDLAGQGLGPRYLGGSREHWALADAERSAIADAAVPVVETYGLTRLSPEWALVATIIGVYLPRAVGAGTSKGDGAPA